MLNKKFIILFISYMTICCNINSLFAQSDWIEWKEDMNDTEDLLHWQEQYETLSELAEHPFNINTITKEQLEQLPFLSDKMIENILYYLYKYGPMMTKNELLGIEGMDRQTRYFFKDFIYVGPSENEQNKLLIRNILKYNKQEILTRLDIPMNLKAGYMDYSEESLSKNPNKKYYGDPLYHNIRYRFRYRDQISLGITAEKDAGEPFFKSYNRKGYDFYSFFFYMQNIGKLKKLALGNYKVSFGQGLVINMDFSMGKSVSLRAMNRMGSGIKKYTSTNEADYLQGGAIAYQLKKRWMLSVFYSFRKMDALVDNMFIRSLKTDGYHRLKKDIEKRNTINNNLIGSNLTYNGKFVELGLTGVYNKFDKTLNPEFHPYNRYYPRGNFFYNVGVHYKLFFHRFIVSGELAVDKQGMPAMLNILTYSPTVNTTLVFMNRYYDKRYQSIYANAFTENSRVQNELGFYIGLETNLLDKIKLLCYGDFFYFPWKRFQVDKDKTFGMEGVCQLRYSLNNSLSMLVKYSYKNKAKNYIFNEKKYVLPNIRQRLHYQLSYLFNEQTVIKMTTEYIHTGYWRQKFTNGIAIGGNGKVKIPDFPIQISLGNVWFLTNDYSSRIYMYEPGLLYAFSMAPFYGKGMRLAVNLRYDFGDHFWIQTKLGWTHYTDRDFIGSGAEQILGRNKTDLQFQIRIKW